MSDSDSMVYTQNDWLTESVGNITLGSGALSTSIYSNTYPYTISNGSGSTDGYVYTTTGTGIDTITISDWSNINSWNNSLEVKGDANFEGDVKIKGKSLIESLEKIEEKLAILRPNEELEEKWDKLRELRKQYMELEKEILEKEKVWDILKK